MAMPTSVSHVSFTLWFRSEALAQILVCSLMHKYTASFGPTAEYYPVQQPSQFPYSEAKS